MPVFSLQFALEEVPTYAGRYAYEDDKGVLAIGQRAHRRGCYTLDEFLRVCRWKTPRSGPLVALNTAASVEAVTRIALSEATGERERMEALRSLSGVGWPTASVLLHLASLIATPSWTFELYTPRGVRAPAAYSFKFWQAYVAVCVELANEAGVDGRTFDQALWQWSKEQSVSLY
jgi:hypothetical protein